MNPAGRQKVLMAWSSGKDSALSLAAVLAEGKFDVVSLLTTLTSEYDRVSIHGVRRELLQMQAEALGLPIRQVVIPPKATNEEYESRMAAALEPFCRHGVAGVVFGDIFLADLRKYREEKLALAGLKGIFPIWRQDTRLLARQAIEQGFRAIVTCADTQHLDASFAGRDFDEAFLADLPAGVDPCGENGEFHTFVHQAPIFRRPLKVRRGQVVLREERFCYCDLMRDP